MQGTSAQPSNVIKPAFFVLLLAPVLAMMGCSPDLAYPATVRYDFAPHTIMEGTDNPKKYDLPKDKADYLEKLLVPVFGSPREPLVKLDEATNDITELQLSSEALKIGSKLYRAQCLDCHGKEGNGLGKSSFLLNPTPRDYRQGKFKFISTVRTGADGKPDTGIAAYPSRADLAKTIRNGVPGAGMSGFQQKDQKEADALVSYVIHLTLRGIVEYRLLRLWEDEDEKPTEKDLAKELKEILKLWAADARTGYTPQVPWEVIEKNGLSTQWAKGKDLFLNKAGCPDCHGKSGKALVSEAPNIATMKDDWGTPIKPRDYTQEPFRGGDRPIDLFYRIRLGIKPSRMQAADMTKLTDADIWHLVGYIKTLPLDKQQTAAK